MNLSIIILNYKQANLIKYQLKKLYYYDFPFESEIIVVDNNSHDKISEVIDKNFPNVKLITGKNIGYGGGNNFGIKSALGEYVLILNPDIRIKKDVILKLYEFIKNREDIGLVAPRLINADGSIQDTCFAFPDWKYPIYRRTKLAKTKSGKQWLENFLMKKSDRNSTMQVDWIMGACFMMKKSTMENIGYFDENIFMYLEDMDLCRRLWEKNKAVYYMGKIFAIHLHQQASHGKNIIKSLLNNKLSRIHLNSWIYYMKKYRNKKLPLYCPSTKNIK
ncbi:MAG: glycosyltransferase family 2 protein [Patescibacteria group bacterium]|nr:glycosyltransferase family 2 protein [Patescibacteria group bacterium]MDD4304818.1 glycosyltransferase family 2 protein [Patescibacteria group bacterium]MDD4695791.1 glycosyltransferase family 2 protein [Patescibacteria group bacterium]